MAFTDLNGMLLGTSTAAIQIEGGDKNNNWYDWSTIPGNIKDGSTPLRTTDHWNKWAEDTQLMADMGLQIYRMGVEWSRIEPNPGEFDSAVIDRYRQEIGMMRDAGIQPLVTLHHFTNPSWFQGLGEWTSDDAVKIWLRFVRFVVTQLRDLVTDWVTINEPNVYAAQTRLWGEAPPGIRDIPGMRRVMAHLAEAHNRAYLLIHQLQPEAKVSVAHHMRVFDPVNPKNPVHIAAAKASQELFQDVLADAMFHGDYKRLLGKQPKGIFPGRYYDYLGLNYYARTASKGLADGTFPRSPVNDLGWEIYPAGIERAARWLVENFDAPVWITENGTCDNGGDDGQLERFRSRFIHDHLTTLAESGLPIERYYHWCFVDNWEWQEGEIPRFGLVWNDYETQTRTVKPSGEFVSQIIKDGGITDEARARWVEPQKYDYLH